MKYAYWDDITTEYQNKLLERQRERDMAVRARIIEDFGVAKADEVYYTNLDYINDWKYPEGFLFDICEDCGRPRQLMKCLLDEPASFQARHCIYKCPCSKIHHTY